jgi:ferredoxin
MKVIIDHDECIGCELCADDCPEVFEMRDGLSWLKGNGAEGPADDAHRGCAEEAADVCPTEAIVVED